MRYFLIDKVTELVVGERASGIKNVTLTDEVLSDHFPGYPIMPAALILEAAAQLGGFLIELTSNAELSRPPRRAIVTQMDRCKFHEVTGPGDQLLIGVSYLQSLDAAARLKAEVRVLEKRVARAELTFALRTVEVDAIATQRRALYRLWTRDLDLQVPIR